MKPHHNPDLTQGPVGPHLIRMALPVIVGQLIVLVYALADSYFVSQIDPRSTGLISGMGLVFPLFFLFIALSQGLSAGTSSLVSRALGARDEAALDRAGDSALVAAAAGTVLAAAFFYAFGNSLVALIAGSSLSAQAVASGQTFLWWLIPGLSLLLVNNALSGILQGEGRMMVTFQASLLSVAANLILDPVLIFGFRMGIAGAGLATSLSIALSTGFLLATLGDRNAAVRIRFRVADVRPAVIGEVFRVGAPQAGGMMLLSLGFLLINYAVSSLGEDLMNAWALVGRADDLILMVAYGLSAAVLTMTGQNSAAGRWDRVRDSVRTGVFYGVGASLVLSVLYILLSRPLFSLFSANPAVVDHCVQQVAWISWSYFGVVAAIVINAFFLGLGRPWAGVVLTLVRMELVLVPGVFLVVFVLGGQMAELLLFFALANVLTLPLSWWWASRLWGKAVPAENPGGRAAGEEQVS